MKEVFSKININGGAILGLILFTVCVIYLNGYMRYISIPPALACFFTLINSFKKNKSELVKYLFYLSGALCAGSVGVLTYQQYWNNDAWLIAKIGFLIFVGAFFVGSIVFIIVSLALIIKCLRKTN